jgi:uncharacterized membrane protein YbaN (DUF454 family)
MSEEDFSHEVRPHDSALVRHAFLGAGFLFVGLAVLGVFLPVLPATPFVLVAAACFARASPRFYNWVMNHRVFGPTVREWRRYRSIPYRVKLWAIALMALSLGVSITFYVRPAWLQAVLAVFGVLLAAWLYRLPSRD